MPKNKKLRVKAPADKVTPVLKTKESRQKIRRFHYMISFRNRETGHVDKRIHPDMSITNQYGANEQARQIRETLQSMEPFKDLDITVQPEGFETVSPLIQSIVNRKVEWADLIFEVAQHLSMSWAKGETPSEMDPEKLLAVTIASVKAAREATTMGQHPDAQPNIVVTDPEPEEQERKPFVPEIVNPENRIDLGEVAA